jgi:DNA-binding response OmpR family regulator
MREHFVSRFRVIEAGDGAEGAALAREHLPDVVISDVMMPVADGYELCRVLRSSPETDFIPVILLTAQATTEHRIAGLERGADDYIVKPFEMRELEARVDNLIASRRRLRERFAKGHVELRPRGDTVLPADQEFIDRVRAAIEANLADADFGVAELAKAVFQDRSHLFRRIRELLAESPSELIRRLRLARAEQLLGDETATVADVAYAVGFNSVSYFCRCFQDIHGVTPAVFRGQLIPR